jgi:lysozyme
MITNINDQLIRDEGMRLFRYPDSRGFDTIGVGHNLDANPLPFDVSKGITRAQALQILGRDVERTSRALVLRLPWVVKLSDARYGVLQNMAFNCGVPGLLEFHHDLADTEAGNYVKAVADMRASAWYTEVGMRAQRLCEQMLTGCWV